MHILSFHSALSALTHTFVAFSYHNLIYMFFHLQRLLEFSSQREDITKYDLTQHVRPFPSVLLI